MSNELFDDQVALSDNEKENYSDNERKDDDNDDNDNFTERKIDPLASSKKRIIRNPQAKLNAERLRGPKGVHKIEEYFKGFKWQGKNHEASDLNKVMKRLEHWGHRLFPKYNFDDLLDKLSILGTKKEVQVFLTKYKKDMLNDDLNENELNDDDEDDDNDNDNVINNLNTNHEKTLESVDEFDRLIAEQLEKTRQSSISLETSLSSQVNVNDNCLNSSIITTQPPPPPPPVIDEEIKKRIEKNRQIALAKKMAKLKTNQELKQSQSASPAIESQLQIENTSSVETFIAKNNNEEKILIDADKSLPEASSSDSIIQQSQQHHDSHENIIIDQDHNDNTAANLTTSIEPDINEVVNDKNITNLSLSSSTTPTSTTTTTTTTISINDSSINSSGKRALTNDELDKEIDDAVYDFMKRKRQSK